MPKVRDAHDRITLAAAIFAAVFAGVAASFTGYQAYIAKDVANKQLRAYVFVKAYPRVNAVNAQTLVAVRNGGQTPASDLILRASLAARSSPPDPTHNTFLGATERAVVSVLEPSTDYRSAVFNIDKPISGQEYDAIGAGELKLFVWGTARYRDIFNEIRDSFFCFEFRGLTVTDDGPGSGPPTGCQEPESNLSISRAEPGVMPATPQSSGEDSMLKTIVLLASFAAIIAWFYFIQRPEHVLGTIRAKFNRWTGYRHQRLFNADSLVPVIDALLQNKECNYRYRLARVDDTRGGLWGVLDRKKSLARRRMISLWELEGYHDAMEWSINRRLTMGSIPDVEIEHYRIALPAFKPALQEAQQKIFELRSHDQILGELDLAARQLKIAFWSAMGSIASAFAAFIAAVIAYANIGTGN